MQRPLSMNSLSNLKKLRKETNQWPQPCKAIQAQLWSWRASATKNDVCRSFSPPWGIQNHLEHIFNWYFPANQVIATHARGCFSYHLKGIDFWCSVYREAAHGLGGGFFGFRLFKAKRWFFAGDPFPLSAYDKFLSKRLKAMGLAKSAIVKKVILRILKAAAIKLDLQYRSAESNQWGFSNEWFYKGNIEGSGKHENSWIRQWNRRWTWIDTRRIWLFRASGSWRVKYF